MTDIKRLVRVAIFLFLGASIMIFLVLQRLERAKAIQDQYPKNAKVEAANAEVQMAYIGMGIVGLMLLAGTGLMITALVRSRKKPGLPASKIDGVDNGHG